MRKKIYTIAAIITVLVFLVTGCSGCGDKNKTTPTTEASGEETTDETTGSSTGKRKTSESTKAESELSEAESEAESIREALESDDLNESERASLESQLESAESRVKEASKQTAQDKGSSGTADSSAGSETTTASAANETTAAASAQTTTVSMQTTTASAQKGTTAASHTHSYTATVTKQPTCTDTGVRHYACSCGASYDESIPALGHDWVASTKIVHHDAVMGIVHHDEVGHYEEQPVMEAYEQCNRCKGDFSVNYSMGAHQCSDGYWSSGWHTGYRQAGTQQVYVVDTPAYDSEECIQDEWNEEVTTYTCSRCGATRNRTCLWEKRQTRISSVFRTVN